MEYFFFFSCLSKNNPLKLDDLTNSKLPFHISLPERSNSVCLVSAQQPLDLGCVGVLRGRVLRFGEVIFLGKIIAKSTAMMAVATLLKQSSRIRGGGPTHLCIIALFELDSATINNVAASWRLSTFLAPLQRGSGSSFWLDVRVADL